MLHEERHYIEVAFFRGEEKRRRAIAIARIDIHALLDEGTRSHEIALTSGFMKVLAGLEQDEG